MSDIHNDVVIGIYVWGTTDEGKPVTTCGFLENSHGELCLPRKGLADDRYAAQIAISMFREYINVEPRQLDIVPLGFFDPIDLSASPEDRFTRTILLGYKTRIHPGTPVHPDLRFFRHDELELARPRITRGHYEAYRTGVSG
jgi:hypothetical protein